MVIATWRRVLDISWLTFTIPDAPHGFTLIPPGTRRKLDCSPGAPRARAERNGTRARRETNAEAVAPVNPYKNKQGEKCNFYSRKAAIEIQNSDAILKVEEEILLRDLFSPYGVRDDAFV